MSITVKSQKEWDAIPNDYNDIIYLEIPEGERIILTTPKGWRVVARENSSVVARENSSVVAWGNSSVEAWGNSSVVARGNSSVVAWENSSVVAWGNSSVVAWENSSVEAWENSSVVAWENSSVEAWENSSVVAWENSSVAGQGNTQIAQYSDRATLKVKGNARIVHSPKTAEEYCDFYGIEVRDGQALLHKAVRSNLASLHDSFYQYEIGKTFTHRNDTSIDRECSYGLHISHLMWAIDFGRSSCVGDFKIIECLVPLDKIVVPKFTDGKVRTSELTVVREVPVEEWGIYGKILRRKS